MAGDYTRFTFRPERDHASVLMQQGRVQLDADWNEQAELTDRRFRVETVDIVGRCGVPRETPAGFEIAAVAGGGYTVGIGRAYVDGLLAENRGVGPLAYEPVWGERIGTQPTPYATQPYLNPAPSPPTGAGPHLCYLDVWQREVTAAENPDLVEPAVGVDTATRLQTVWQVRWLENVGAGVTCASDWTKVPKWVDATQPSGGRLTTAAIGVSAPADPCLIEPAGGYRGAENRLYRVEIHDDGSDPLRPASFKWSRDNGAVAAVIDSITDPTGAPKVKVSRIGRDEILRFHDGDRVELLDDVLELSGAPGVMARIAPNGVDAATNTITLDAALVGSVDTTRHARLRRWDQRAGVNARGVIEVSQTPIELEFGIEVTLEVEPGGRFRVGDYWAFAARTANAQVEILTREPPRGIRHHFCRLAVLAGGKLEDCRVLYPPELPAVGCDCDVCVTPESHRTGTLTIQQAIDKVAKTGGKVCLAAGRYRIARPVRIRGARSVTLAGKGHQTVLVHPANAPAIEIASSIEVTVRSLAVTTAKARPSDRVPPVAIAVSGAAGTTIERCFIGQASALVPGSSTRDAFHAGIGIGLNGFLAETVIRENVILADIGVGSATLDRPKAAGVSGREGSTETASRSAAVTLTRYFVTHGLYVEDNLLVCRRAGIDLGRAGRAKAAATPPSLLVHFGDTRIAGNSLYACSEVGIIVSGLVLDALTTSTSYAASAPASGPVIIDYGPFGPLGALVRAGSSRLDVADNVLSVLGYGIYVASTDARIAGNDLTGLGAGETRPDGITLGSGARGRTTARCQVLANRIRRFAGNGILLDATRSTIVKLNIVEGVNGGGIVARDADLLTIENNEVLDAGREAVDAKDSVFGVAVSNSQRIRVAGNKVVGVGLVATEALSRVGIELLGCPEAQVSENEVREVGPPGEFTGAAVGIEVTEGYERTEIANNIVRIGAGDGVSRSVALAVGTLERLGRLRVATRARARTEALYFSEIAVPLDDAIVIGSFGDVRTVPLAEGTLAVHGNELDSAGNRSAVEIEASGSCLFSDNRCRVDAAERRLPVVVIEAPNGAVVANANYLAGSRDAVGFVIDPAVDAGGRPLATVLGNIGDGDIVLSGGGLAGTPWADLNVRT